MKRVKIVEQSMWDKLVVDYENGHLTLNQFINAVKNWTDKDNLQIMKVVNKTHRDYKKLMEKKWE